MKRFLLLAFFITCVFVLKTEAQGGPFTLDVVSWNIEFFGDPTNGPANDDLQEANVKKILRWLNADLYGMLEVVDTTRFRRLVDSLGNNEFGYFIAPFCSNNQTGTGNGWLKGQKQAFIYRKSVFSNITTRGIMRGSSTGYTNWAAGRFPFLFTATATVNGTSRDVNFILIHGKSGAAQSDYDKRFGGANELKDSLDAQFGGKNIYIIGDYNDALNTSIYLGANGVTSYVKIVEDSTIATGPDYYKSITLPLGASGQSSMINFPNVIDNHIISNGVIPWYVPGSAKIMTNVTTIIPDYVTAHNTSDHYPVFSSFDLAGVITGITNVSANELGVKIFPNPFSNDLNVKATKTLTNVTMQLLNMQGQVMSKQTFGLITAGSIVKPTIPVMQRGVYFLKVETKQYNTVLKVVEL